jgi:hypothetical protein
MRGYKFEALIKILIEDDLNFDMVQNSNNSIQNDLSATTAPKYPFYSAPFITVVNRKPLLIYRGF